MKHLYKMKMCMIVLLLLCLTPYFTWAQTKIAGLVKDDAQQPIPGVSVLVKGTKRATSTDLSGRFSLDAKTGETLVLS